MWVEACVDVRCAFQELSFAESVSEYVAVGEIASLGAVEQGDDFATAEFCRCVCWADEAGCRWLSGWGVDCEVDEKPFGSADDQSGEGVGLLEYLDVPASLVGCSDESGDRELDVSLVVAGEEVEVLGGACGQSLGH